MPLSTTSQCRGTLRPLVWCLGEDRRPWPSVAEAGRYHLCEHHRFGALIVLAIFVYLLGARGTMMQVTVFETAMAPMSGASIVAMDNDLDPSLATLFTALGVPLSFIMLAVWHQVLTGF